MKKILLWLICFCLLFLVWCNVKDSNQWIKIWVIVPLSWPMSSKWDALKNGILLAEEQFKGDKNIEFVFEDHQYDAKTAISAFQKLVNVDHVDMVLNRWEPTSEAIAPLVKEYEVPTIALIINDEPSKWNPYFFRFYDPSADLIRPLPQYASDMWYNKIALLITENTFLQDVWNKFMNQANELWLQVDLLDVFQRWETNFQTTIMRIKEWEYDAVACFLWTTSISQFHKQMEELWLNLPILWTDFYEDPAEIEASNWTIDGTIYTSYGVNEEFRNDFMNHFGDEWQIPTASFTYDATKMILERIDFSSKSSMLDSLLNINWFVWSQWEYTFINNNDDKYFSRPVILKTILNWKIANY